MPSKEPSSQPGNFHLPPSLVTVWPFGNSADDAPKSKASAKTNIGWKKKTAKDSKPEPPASFLGKWMANGEDISSQSVDDKKKMKQTKKAKEKKTQKKTVKDKSSTGRKSTEKGKKKQGEKEELLADILSNVVGSLSLFDGDAKSESDASTRSSSRGKQKGSSRSSFFRGWSASGKKETVSKEPSSSLFNRLSIVGNSEEALEIIPTDNNKVLLATSVVSRWVGKSATDAIETEVGNSKAIPLRKQQASKHSTKGTAKEEVLKSSLVKGGRPSVYEEAMEMLTAALLIYTFADLRKMARDGEIVSKDLEADPIVIGAIAKVVQKNRLAIQKRARIDETGLESRLRALRDIQKQQLKSSSVLDRMMRGKETILTNFHDEASTKGMVYGIAVNHIRRRITIIFRGSVTQQDFVTDAKFSQKKVANPVAGLGRTFSVDMPATINIHTGFYEYLFQKDDQGILRLEHILSDAKKLLKQNPDYRLFCTGHSLGGALATMCGYYAALDTDIVKNGPVAIYSIASPRVGNSDFRQSFQLLERLKRLQHVRITNREDIVTHIPFVALEQITLSPTSVLSQSANGAVNLYKHCGLHLELKASSDEHSNNPKQLFTITYAKDKNDQDDSILPEELKRSVVAGKSLIDSLLATNADIMLIVKYHSCDQYEQRLLKCRQHLAGQTLDDFYSNERIVGAAVAWRANKKAKSSFVQFLPSKTSATHRNIV